MVLNKYKVATHFEQIIIESRFTFRVLESQVERALRPFEDGGHQDPPHSSLARERRARAYLLVHACLRRLVALDRGVACAAIRRRGSGHQSNARSGDTGRALRDGARKVATHTLKDSTPVHSLRTLFVELATQISPALLARGSPSGTDFQRTEMATITMV
jgi:hypothetical protein